MADNLKNNNYMSTRSNNSRDDLTKSKLEKIESEIDSLRKLIIDQNAKTKKLVYLMIINLYLVVVLMLYFLLIT